MKSNNEEALAASSAETLRIFNTITGNVEDFKSVEARKIGIYVCGVTVYDYSHMGHARTIIFFDLVRRYLLHKGYSVTYVQNFTDVDDKIINRAREMGIKPSELAERFIRQYEEDFQKMGVLRPDFSPKATQHVQDMINIIQRLIDLDYGYVTSNGVYYRVKKFREYGNLSKKPIPDLLAGARVEVDTQKEDPLDFALWKFSTEEPFWESPWGKGRPGWHIECSAMASRYLGETIDIHGGGKDLIFPHHENEIAQSEAANLKPFAQYWVHVGLVSMEKEKMSKSLGNIVTLDQALKAWGANTIRIYCLSTHYSKPLEYSERGLRNAQNNWKLIEQATCEVKSASLAGGTPSDLEKVILDYRDEFCGFLNKNFDTVGSMSVMMRFARYINRLASQGVLTKDCTNKISKLLEDFLFVLGLKLPTVTDDETREVEMFLQERNKLREVKDYKAADSIREKLKKRGFEFVDYPNRTVWWKIG